MVAAEDGDIACLEPGDDRRIEPRRPAAFGPAAKPRPGFLAARPHTGAHEQGVAGSYLDAGLLFPRFEVLDIDWRARFQIRNTLEPRNVDQDAARKNSALDVVDGIFCVALFQHGVRIGLVAVVERAV